MKDLFNENIDQSTENSLKIVAKGQQNLSKNQKQFNTLTKRISDLENQIEKEKQFLSTLLESYNKDIKPAENKNALARLELAMVIGKSVEKNKYTKKQLADITEAIITLCDQAFMQIDPDKEQEAFYDTWATTTYKQSIEEQTNQDNDLFADFVKDMYDIDVDLDALKNDPEELASLQDELKKRMEEDAEYQQQNQKKTKKQLEKQKTHKAEEEIKSKSIRSIYIALVKILHPDTETDIALKAEKENIMKQVTEAYDRKDLPVLLKLEIEWIHKTAEHLELLTDEKLKLYISTLKQQVSELEQERFMLTRNPRFIPVFEYAERGSKYALQEIKTDAKELKDVHKQLHILTSTFKYSGSKASILSFVKAICERNIEEEEARSLWDI